ncbi:putative transposase IS891/IS1136/IS1341 family protein [Kalymmatonema gypsitolerans NIES-4073]|nr:putative transposase IS891/IS1136/IS1341 family protein [Scytonema sp. NIES-4073]
MLSLTYEYKAMPTSEQIQQIEHTLTVCRKVWNFALLERKDWLNSRSCPINACSIVSEYITPANAPYPNYYEQANALTREDSGIPGTYNRSLSSTATSPEKTGNRFCGYE